MISLQRLKEFLVVRGLNVSAAVLTGALLLAGCGGSGRNDGGMPTPAGGGDDTAGSTSTSSPTPGVSASKPTGSTSPAQPKAQVYVVAGRFRDSPAVQGLVRTYPAYYRALVARDDNIVKNSFPGFFYTDTALDITEAKKSGYVMRPPGSIVVMGLEQQPYGIIRVRTCRSQRTQYWNPKARQWAKVAPKGSPEVYDMVETGLGWMMYRVVTKSVKPYSCATVHYPA
jgi:hypothetical protein